MFFPPGLARIGDWPDVASAGVPAPLLVQYCADDELFALDGMRAADDRIRAEYRRGAAADGYRAEWRPGQHRFDVEMQESAFGWLEGARARVTRRSAGQASTRTSTVWWPVAPSGATSVRSGGCTAPAPSVARTVMTCSPGVASQS